MGWETFLSKDSVHSTPFNVCVHPMEEENSTHILIVKCVKQNQLYDFNRGTVSAMSGQR